MKKLFLITLLLVTFFSCKKDKVDLRDTLIGSYEVSFTALITGSSGQTTDTGSYSLVVAKGNTYNQLLFTDPREGEYTVILEGTNFTIPIYSQTLFLSGMEYNRKVFGSGSFHSDSIIYAEQVEVFPTNIPITSNVSGSKQ